MTVIQNIPIFAFFPLMLKIFGTFPGIYDQISWFSIIFQFTAAVITHRPGTGINTVLNEQNIGSPIQQNDLLPLEYIYIRPDRLDGQRHGQGHHGQDDKASNHYKQRCTRRSQRCGKHNSAIIFIDQFRVIY